jgi:hypothetical protein
MGRLQFGKEAVDFLPVVVDWRRLVCELLCGGGFLLVK